MILDTPPASLPPISVVKGMTPELAAAALLGSRPHGPIDHWEWRPDFEPTTVTDAWRLELIEKPTRAPGGCVRQRWAIGFAYRFDAPVAARLPQTIYVTSEVALHAGDDCSSALSYVRVNPGVDPAAAIGALQRLAAIERGQATQHLDCTDLTPSHFCADAATLGRRLAALDPWLVARDGAATSVSVGVPGTVVSWPDAHPGTVSIRRQIPPPF